MVVFYFHFTNTRSVLCSAADTVSSSSWPVLFKVLTLSDAICTMLLHFSNFCLYMSSVIDFSKTGARTSTCPLFIRMKGNVVWTYGLCESHANLLMAVFYLINRHHSYR